VVLPGRHTGAVCQTEGFKTEGFSAESGAETGEIREIREIGGGPQTLFSEIKPPLDTHCNTLVLGFESLRAHLQLTPLH